MIPVFILSIMMMGFLLKEFFQIETNHRKKFLNYSLKGVKFGVIIIICIFFIFSIYFFPSTQSIMEDGWKFNDPQLLDSRYPLDMEGLDRMSVLLVQNTNIAFDYDVIPLKLKAAVLAETEDYLDYVLEKNYDVYVLKTETYPGEKKLLRNLINEKGLTLKDYSKTFCKVQITNGTGSIDKVCIIPKFQQ